MISVLECYLQLREMVFDQLHLKSVADARLACARRQSSGRFIAGNFLTGPIPAEADAYLLEHVQHDWSDDEAIMILAKIRAVMEQTEGGTEDLSLSCRRYCERNTP